jgi:DNA-directed RNA polymerase beta' subunit
MIKTVNVNQLIKESKAIGPIKTHQIYFDKSLNYHPQGLYSEDIFGMDGSKERRVNISWIELNTFVIHPVLHDILSKRIFRKINDLLSGETNFSLNPNNELIEDDMGNINGISSLLSNINDVKFSRGEDGSDRNRIIDMLYTTIKDKTFFIDKIPVISPEYRPIQIDETTGDIQIDDLTKLYQRIITASSQLGSVSGPLYDILSYRMQLLIRDLYELIKVKISKKEGLIRSQLLGKRVDFSASAVISPQPSLPIGYVGVPLRLLCHLFEPYLIYGFMNSGYSSLVPDKFHIEVKKFLAKESSLEE